jgi:uncharacterized protein (DUF1501 family)
MPAFTRRALLSHLLLAAQPVVQEPGRHTLVCVFLRGGADTLNLLVPYGDDVYYRKRPTLGIAAPDKGPEALRSVRLDDFYALHPSLKPLAAKFHEGRLGFVQAVGIPDNLSGSHFDSQDQMEHGDSAAGTPAGGGWLGRFLRNRADKASSPLQAVALGTKLPESLRGAPAASVLQTLEEIAIKTPSNNPKAVAAALARLYGADVTMLGERGRESLELFHRVAALQRDTYQPANGAVYPKDSFGSGLREIARLVKARVGLEVACVDLNNWDTHFFQGNAVGAQADRARVLGQGLDAFETDLLAERANVSVLVVTEFGRRIYENSSAGTDHGRGFAAMLLSDKIKGGRVLGPRLFLEDDGEGADGMKVVGGMRIVHDFRDLFSDVLRGVMGVAQTHPIFPGYAPGTTGLLA